MSQPYLSVVIPAYNEEPRIAGTLDRITGYLDTRDYSWEVVVADDGSADATAEIVGRAASRRPNVHLLSLPHRGKGWAVKNGMLAASGDYRLLCDADLSVPIQQVERMLPPLAPDVDIVVGSREAEGAARYGEPPRRHLMGRVYNQLARRFAASGLDDTQCGFKCFKSGPAARLFEQQTLNGFAFDVEVLYLAQKQGFSIKETGVDWYYRDQSKVRPVRDSLAMGRDLLKIWWRHRK